MNRYERLQSRFNHVWSLLIPNAKPLSIEEIRNRIVYEQGVWFWHWLISRERSRPKDRLDTSLSK